MMRYSLLFFVLAQTAALVAGCAELSDGITSAAYPDADTVTVDDREEMEYFPDGTYRSVEEIWTKALTEAGRRELSTTSLGYSRRYGTAKIAEVAIIGEDGVRRPVDLEGLVKESTDNSSTAVNIYDPLDRQIACTIPGVKVGDTVYVRKERSTFAARCQDQWATISVFEDFAPVVRASLRVKCPKELPICRAAVRNPLGNVVSSAVTNDDGSVVLEWCATNSPQAFWEPSMPTPYKQLQHVALSTAADWREMSRWYWELCAPHLAKTNAAMVAKVAELREKVGREGVGVVGEGVVGESYPPCPHGGVENDPLLKEVFRFVSQEIRYMGLTMEDTSPGYAPHDVDITFDKRYGVCRDKAGLLVAMLRLAGFKAYPVLIMAGSSKMDPDVPSPYFNHAIVAVEKGEGVVGEGVGGYVLMDPTAESTKDLLPSYESDCSYLVARPDGEGLLTTPMPPADENLLKIDSSATLDADGSLLIESDLRFDGLNDNVFRRHFLKMKPVDRRRYLEEVVAEAYPGARLLKCEIVPAKLQDVSVPLSATLCAKVPEVLLRGESEIRLTTGWLSQKLGIANMLLSGRTALEQRRFPLRLASTAGIAETLRITLGDALGPVKSVPAPVAIEGSYEYRFAAAVTNGEYTLSRVLKVNSLEFSPEEYQALRERIKTVEAAERRRAVFDADRLADADIRYRLRGMSVGFTGDRSWTVTNTVVKEILTYDGKKENSEITFEFNPLVRKVRVLRASVTGTDGTTVFASEKELTELDCDWAATAPRYPASRKLVLTLPSVEIGSVLTTVVEQVVTDSPDAFRHRFYLDAVEPTDVLVYRLGDEVRRVDGPERIPIEDGQPVARRWRKNFVVDRGTFAATCALLRKAAEVAPLDPSVLQLDTLSPKTVRDWMAKHVRVSGPTLYELPLERQLTDPATVVKERYATRLDYIRTLCALLKGAGYAADVVFASPVRGDDERYPAAYAEAVCRLDGLFLGLENEYTPLEATANDGCWYLDPATEKEDVIRVKGDGMAAGESDLTVITVRPNGAVDYDYELLRRGSAVGKFRKRYEEMLPEERSRHYQTLIGGVAQSASATSDLVTDTCGYPARLAFSCYIPDYAVVEGDTVTLEVKDLSAGFDLTGDVRKSPMGIDRKTPSVERWRIVLPEGYTEVEQLPEPMVVHDPCDPGKVWWKTEVSSEVKDGRLEVEIVRETFARETSVVARDYFPLLRDWARRGTSPSSRTITVRR